MSVPEPIRYLRGDATQSPVLELIDQTQLPESVTMVQCTSVDEVHDAIVRLVVRGAPAIGIAAAYGVTLTSIDATGSIEKMRVAYRRTIDHLATSRPTAVNLFWALDRMREIVDSHPDPATLAERLAQTAIAIHDDDRAMCRAIGNHGAALLIDCENILTHCNAGALATSTLGTALAPIYQVHSEGKRLHVWADETRPLLQGSRLTAWELNQAGVDVTVCTDSMSGGLMRDGKVDAVIVGADRIAANGDVANKIGTYPLAILAHYHKIPFYVAAPTNTFDTNLESGELIPIEDRHRDEIARPGGKSGRLTVPDGVNVINPAFDVTPAKLITAIITQLGVIDRPNRQRVEEHLARFETNCSTINQDGSYNPATTFVR